MDLVNNLADFRKKAGLNQAELGGLVGVSRQTISLIERGDYNPCLLYTSPSPRDRTRSRMPSSA